MERRLRRTASSYSSSAMTAICWSMAEGGSAAAAAAAKCCENQADMAEAGSR